jgi:hypothetical protein
MNSFKGRADLLSREKSRFTPILDYIATPARKLISWLIAQVL